MKIMSRSFERGPIEANFLRGSAALREEIPPSRDLGRVKDPVMSVN